MDEKQSIKTSVITLSDRCFKKEQEDLTGPALKNILEGAGIECGDIHLIPDDEKMLTENIKELLAQNIDIIITNGGTGVGPRDITPDVCKKISDYEIPGFGEMMRLQSQKYTPYWVLSRATAVVKNQTLIINFPGNPKAVKELFPLIKDPLIHAVKMIRGGGH